MEHGGYALRGHVHRQDGGLQIEQRPETKFARGKLSRNEDCKRQPGEDAEDVSEESYEACVP